METRDADESPKRRLPKWLGDKVAGSIISFVVAAALAALVAFSVGDKGNAGGGGRAQLSQEIDRVRTRLERAKYQVTSIRREELRPGITSVIVTDLRSVRNEIRIYDFEDGSLRLKLRFAGLAMSSPAPEEPRYRTTTPFVIAEIRNLDDDSDREILGSFDVSLDKGAYRFVPATISWSARNARYELHSLLRWPEPFNGVKSTNENTRYIRQFGWNTPRMRFVIADRDSPRRFTGYALSTFIIAESATGGVPYLLGGVAVDFADDATVRTTIELRLWLLTGERGQVLALPCADSTTPQQFPVFYDFSQAGNEDFTPGLRTVWKQLGPRVLTSSCGTPPA